MAKNRMVNTRFWRDTWVGTLTTSEKLLFLYLLTNPETNVIGIYEISISQMALDTGLEDSVIERMLQKFQSNNRVTYMEGWMIIHNFEKHQSLRGELIGKAKTELVREIPQRVLKASEQAGNPVQQVLGTDSNTLSIRSNTPSGSPSLSKLESNSSKKSNESKSDDLLDIHEHYKSKIHEGARLTNGAKSKIITRLKSYSAKDLKLAMDNFSKDSWKMRHNSDKGMAWFFHSDDRIDQYINLKPKKGIVEI